MTLSINLPESVREKLEERAAQQNVPFETVAERILIASVEEEHARFLAAMNRAFDDYAPTFERLAEGPK